MLRLFVGLRRALGNVGLGQEELSWMDHIIHGNWFPAGGMRVLCAVCADSFRFLPRFVIGLLALFSSFADSSAVGIGV